MELPADTQQLGRARVRCDCPRLEVGRKACTFCACSGVVLVLALSSCADLYGRCRLEYDVVDQFTDFDGYAQEARSVFCHVSDQAMQKQDRGQVKSILASYLDYLQRWLICFEGKRTTSHCIGDGVRTQQCHAGRGASSKRVSIVLQQD